MSVTNYTVAARWWADQLRRNTKQDNGEREGLANVVAVLKGGSQPEDLVEKFEAALLRMLEEKGSKLLSTDYDPSGLLVEAAREAGIPASCGPFPLKTVMWIEDKSVSVKHGYGAATQKLL